MADERPKPRPRLKWHRRQSGIYRAGPWLVRRYPYHRPIWELRKDESHVGNFGTAADAKDHAAQLELGDR